MSESPASSRLRLNWFSPLPPARTDIAHYAMRTLPALSQSADVTVWTEQPGGASGIDAYADLRHWRGDPWVELNSADATLYHIGNEPTFHGWIWEIARRHPGIVVLHDTRLHEFFAGHLLGTCGDPDAYVAAARHCHGDAGARRARQLLRGEATATALGQSLPMTQYALERACGAVVHTNAAFAEVASVGRVPVLQLDLPYGAGPPPAARDWDGPLRLIVFGYLGANRRVDALLEALAFFPGRERLRLEIVGQLHDADALNERIQAFGIGDLVTVRGYVPESELDQILDRAHLAINLRYPTMGEASGSQLRVWSRGLASVVTRTGWYADLPSDTVWFIDPWNEVRDLQSSFNAALTNPGSLLALGEAGRRHLEARHDPELYARELATGVVRMMQRPASIVAEITASVGRELTASTMPRAVQHAVAIRAARQLTEWASGNVK